MGAEYTIDPTITPMMDGDRSILQLGLGVPQLKEVFRDPETWSARSTSSARRRPPVNDDVLEELPCSAGHTACYISPYGDVFPCVQFPLPSGNVRQQKFMDIWQSLRPAERSALDNRARSAGLLELHPCRDLHAMPRAGLHGRQHARPVHAGLREVVRANRNSVGQHDSQEGVVRDRAAWCRSPHSSRHNSRHFR